MTSLTDRIKGAKAPTYDVKISLDGALSAARDEAMREHVEAARQVRGIADGADNREAQARMRKAQKNLHEIDQQLKDSVITIRFTGVSYKLWSQFVRENPPRKGQKEIANPETLYAYVARRTGQLVENDGSLVDIDKADWDALEDALTDGEYGEIMKAIGTVNAGVGRAGIGFLSRASGTTRPSAATSE